MRRALGIAGTSLLWIVIVALFALALVPRFLDHRYYDGPVSDHYDGERFANIDTADTAASPAARSPLGFTWRVLTGGGRAPWPDHVDVPAGAPHPLLTACPRLTGGARAENWAACNRGAIPADAMAATWIGHATVLVQAGGTNILTDPVWSDRVGPLGIGPTRVTPPGMTIDALPRIDIIVVSHSHYDHMDIASLKALWDRDRPVIITGLGNDAILRAHGIGAVALDWNGVRAVGQTRVRLARNHHWSSRWGTDRNRALWAGFVIDTPAGRIVFAGDTGLGDGRWPAEMVADGVPARLAILPIGAFRFEPGQMHVDSHIGPAQAAMVWNRLGRPTAMAIHWGTFRLSNEARMTPPRMLGSILSCAGADTNAFAAWPMGEARLVPPVTARPPVDERAVAACENSAPVRAMP